MSFQISIHLFFVNYVVVVKNMGLFRRLGHYLRILMSDHHHSNENGVQPSTVFLISLLRVPTVALLVFSYCLLASQLLTSEFSFNLSHTKPPHNKHNATMSTENVGSHRRRKYLTLVHCRNGHKKKILSIYIPQPSSITFAFL